ncbi:hypothetical protein GLOIN_2v1769618 [Rhizophagus irregularis DAOM 181602=DAOM 197198]|nr:hypothetical protein GLOIN_2v1769618 [Rhizophagus irregularis DAOM 181602=DAOM 197198]
MEYGISSIKDDANKTILTALEDLDNTFFTEYSYSEDEKEPSFIPNDDDDDIELIDLSLKVANIHLDNFEFKENPDSYIEDEVYKRLKLKVDEFFLKKKCSCRSSDQPCFMKIGYERFLARRIEFESLDKTMRDMVVKGQLMAFQKDKNTRKVNSNDRKFVRFNYCYNNDLLICRTMYENLIGASHKYLDTIIQHLREHSIEERVHGNTGRAPKNMKRIEVNYDVANDVQVFLKNYSNVHVYRDYVNAYKDKYGAETRVMVKQTFINIWKSLMQSLQFMSPKSDLCENCELMKMDIRYIIQHEKKLESTENYLAHLKRAQQERDYYNSNIALAIEDGRNNSNPSGSQILFKTFEGSAHIAYDWAQNVQIPHSPQQVGSLFFKSPRKVHLFGVCNTGNYPNTQQINYVIDEGEMADDGKQGKGANCTLSLVLHAIQKYNRGEKKLIVACDNCVGQNKNNFTLFFYSWLIDRGIYDEIELNFMIPGHTKFICDGCFGLIKILYRKSIVNTVDDVVSIINRSTTNNFNIAQRYLNGKGFQYYDFKSHFQMFKKLPNIQKYHHFYFSSQHPGVVFYKDKLEDVYEKTTIRTFSYAINILPPIIASRPLSLKRQEELYKEIAPYVDVPFREITCPKPELQNE